MPNPRVRRGARERALQFLFGLEFTHCPWQEAIGEFWAAHPARPGVKQYARKLIQGVSENREELDAEIARVLEHWSLRRVGRVERNVLRIALFEIWHAEDVPRNVAINEAIEIAKRFGADDAPRFINGVLDRLKESDQRPNDS